MASTRKSTSSFSTINANAQIFNELRDSPPVWWAEFKSRNELYIEVRKYNEVHVYHEGGRVGKIQYRPRKAKFYVLTHYKYLGEAKPVTISPDVECSGRIAGKLDDIIRNIELVYSHTHQEEYIKGQLITNHRDIHLDSEFAFNDKERNVRIDLVKVVGGVITFVELKLFLDSRMLNNKAKYNKVVCEEDLPEIFAQMNKYNGFIEKHRAEILEYYQTLYDIKVSLGLLDPEKTARPADVNPKAELLIFNTSEEMSAGETARLAAIEKSLKENGVMYSIKTEL